MNDSIISNLRIYQRIAESEGGFLVVNFNIP